jgi:hypothetical protein
MNLEDRITRIEKHLGINKKLSFDKLLRFIRKQLNHCKITDTRLDSITFRADSIYDLVKDFNAFKGLDVITYDFLRCPTEVIKIMGVNVDFNSSLNTDFVLHVCNSCSGDFDDEDLL